MTVMKFDMDIAFQIDRYIDSSLHQILALSEQGDDCSYTMCSVLALIFIGGCMFTWDYYSVHIEIVQSKLW